MPTRPASRNSEPPAPSRVAADALCSAPMAQTKYVLEESALPRHWYNVRADMPNPMLPILHPGTGQPVGPDDLAPLFPMELILQEVSEEPEIAVPEEVLDLYRLWRPTPLYRAHRLEAATGTRSRIFYKYEGTSPAGSHKPNTAVAQAFYNKREGRKRLATETGAGQWGSALAFACKQLRPRVQGLHGSRLVRPEAVPPLDDPDVGRDDRREPVRGHERRPRDPGRAPGLDRQPRHRDLRGGRGRRDARRHRVLARQRAQPRAAAPDRDRPGGDRADGARRRVPRRGRSAASAAARTSPASRSRSCARRSPDGRSTSSPASLPPARRSRAATSPTTSATRGS